MNYFKNPVIIKEGGERVLFMVDVQKNINYNKKGYFYPEVYKSLMETIAKNNKMKYDELMNFVTAIQN